MLYWLSKEGMWAHLRQDQGVLIGIEFIHGGLLGINRIMEDGQRAQAVHQSIGCGCEHCGLKKQKKGIMLIIDH